MYLVMKSWSCSMYILVFFEYSNSIILSLVSGCPSRSVLIPWQGLERREEHRSRHPPHRYLDQHGPVHLDRVGDELAHLGRLLRAPAHGAVRFGQPHEVGVVQLGRKLSAPVLVEVSRDVAVGIVVENDGYHVDPVLDGRRHLLGIVEEAAVARDHDDWTVRWGHLRAAR